MKWHGKSGKCDEPFNQVSGSCFGKFVLARKFAHQFRQCACGRLCVESIIYLHLSSLKLWCRLDTPVRECMTISKKEHQQNMSRRSDRPPFRPSLITPFIPIIHRHYRSFFEQSSSSYSIKPDHVTFTIMRLHIVWCAQWVISAPNGFCEAVVIVDAVRWSSPSPSSQMNDDWHKIRAFLVHSVSLREEDR